MDFHKLYFCFNKFGGIRLVRQYAKLGVLWIGAKSFFRCIIKRKSFKGIYPDILKKVEPHLMKKYQSVMLENKEFYTAQALEQERSKYIWFCWLQGLELAPEIVKICFKSLKTHLHNREINLIDSCNWQDYVSLPDYIIRKWDKKLIPPALFSDLLRLQLLIKYGGTWIDATVLCTGNKHTSEYLNADLFLFQYTPPGYPQTGNFSNWFISSCTNNHVLLVLRDMLFAYWKDYDCTLDYYIFHLFFKMLSVEYPHEIAAMPYGYSMNSLALLHNWRKPFDNDKWEQLISHVCFHKLSYKNICKENTEKDTYLSWILTKMF